MRKREGTSGVIAIKIARDSNALSVLANYPSLWRDRSYKNGFRYIPQIEDCGKTNGLGLFHRSPALQVFEKNQWVRSSCKFALCQPTQFFVGGNIRYLLNEWSTRLFSYQLHMAALCANGGERKLFGGTFGGICKDAMKKYHYISMCFCCLFCSYYRTI